jgi:hypothetical protein
LHSDSSISGVSKKAEDAFKIQYPSVYAHLLKHKKALESRNKAETGIRYEWYALQRYGSDYIEDFAKPKIVWNRVAYETLFALDGESHFILDSMFFITGVHIMCICGVMNSTVGRYLLKQYCASLGAGSCAAKEYVEKLPIPFPSPDIERAVSDLVTLRISETDPERQRAIEKKIDALVYRLYRLTKKEIALIESK